ncbi:MIT domain-containing protein [Dioscorea alata]|uniref:MIT domain-containing protein n=1 Tax=Dioscorea alata TaxID=55571 RepID=A0ACB7VJ68_DIOAL|nr:MIT domain-containing protein [Dioscorea alata]
MSFFRNLIDSFSQFFLVSDPSSAHHYDPQLMDASAFAARPSVVSERVVNKLKGYFYLAKEEINKAVRAEEWGLTNDAIAHYKNAHRVMLEAKAARVPSAMPSSDQEKVRIYQQKISKWQDNVTERL